MRPRPLVHRFAGLLATTALVVTGAALVPGAATAAPPPAPAAPGLALSGDAQGLTVSWSAGGAGVTGYVVRVSGADGTQVAERQVAAGTTTFTFAGLDNGTYTATVSSLGADGESVPSAASATQALAVPLLAQWSLTGLAATTAGTTVPDGSGNGRNATIRAAGATTVTAPGGNGLQLPGGNAGAYVELPTGLVNGQDTVTVSAWLKNETGSGNYAAAFFGTGETLPSRYFLLNPANPSGRFKSVLTDGAVNATQPWTTERGFSPTSAGRGVAGPVTGSSWGLYTTVITPTTITAYLNGAKIDTVAHTTPLSAMPTNLLGYLGRSSYPDTRFKGGIRDVRVYSTALSDATVAGQWSYERAALDTAELSLPETVLADVELPTAGARGTQVRWSSSDPAVVSAAGRVTRPAAATTVTLTATVNAGGRQSRRAFTVDVPAADPQGDVTRVSEAYRLGISVVAGSITLPTRVDGVGVSWASSAPGVVATDGTVARPAAEQEVTLTATFTSGTSSAAKAYTVRVLATDAGRLGTYIRTGDENRTDAVHLASAPAGGATYTALNNNRPVLYAPNATTKLGSPAVFRRPDGGFGVIATVNSSSTTAWVWDSADLVTFSNPRQVVLNNQGLATAAVGVAYDNAVRAYRLTYTSGTTTYQVRTADFTTVSAPVVVPAPAVAPVETFPAGALEASSIGVTAAELAVVERKFTRMVNNGTRPVPDVTVPQGGAVSLPVSVTATYTNGGSDTQVPVTWDAGDLAAVDPAKPGTYTVRGTARPTSYPDTIGEKRADPDVTLGDDGFYYMTASFPDAPGAPGYDKVNLRRARTIAGLASAPETTIWDQATSSLERYIWAPELTKIGDSWYVLFTASRSGNVFDIRPAMLRHTGGDLMDPASWVEVGQMLAAPGDTNAFTSFSLDMTHFEHAGTDYVVWAEKPGASQLRIATVDPANPRQLTSRSTLIATPELAWEVNLGAGQYVDEGPAVIERDGRLLMTFSGSTVDDRYSVGLLSAAAGADLLDPASWRKTAYPLLVTGDLPEGQSGPGHNSFTTDELGNTVIVYHSRDLASTTDGGLSDPSRWARARTVHFDADGDPVLNLTPREELAPEHAAVSVRVVVTGAPVTTPPAPPVVIPPLTGPAVPAAVVVKVKGQARQGRTSKLVVTTTAASGRVTVEVGSRTYRVKVRSGRAVLKVRFTQPGKQKVVVKAAGVKEVLRVRVRR